MRSGGDKPQDISVSQMNNHSIPVVANGMQDDGIIGYTNVKNEKAGTLTVSARGTIGHAIVRNYPYYPVIRLIVLSPNSFTISSYLKYIFDYFEEEGTGTSIPQLTVPSLKNKIIPLPPLAEQQRIVDRIESLFAKLDDAREIAQAVVDGFENRKTAILHKAFTGELTRKWREERGIGMESWKQTTLGNIIKVSSGKALTAKNMIRDGIYPVYGGNGITGHHNESNVDKNTIVIGRVGYYCGSVHFLHEPSWVTDNALIVKYDVEQYNTSWLVYILKYLDLRQNDSSTAQPVISGSKIYPICLNICSKAEQTIISNLLDRLLLQEQRARDLAESVIAQIDGMKKAILARAFRGELGTNVPWEAACEV